MKIIVGAVGGAVILGILVVLLIVLRAPGNISHVLTGTATRTTIPAEPITFLGTVEAVRAGGDVGACQRLNDAKNIDDCYYAIATQRTDLTVCAKIKDAPSRSSCEGAITLAHVRESGTYDACVTLQNTIQRIDCINLAVSHGVKESFCNVFTGNDQSLCLNQVQFFAALAGGANACETISDTKFKTECQQIKDKAAANASAALIDSDHDGLTDIEEASLGTDLHNLDTDGDGLTDGDEVHKYHTNPLKADTDDDGFSDGQEVKSGHNPLGPG